MSKLAVIRQYQYSPAAGGFFSFLPAIGKAALKFVGKGLGIIKPAVPKIVETAAAAAKNPAAAAILAGAGGAAAGALLKGGGGGASGSWAPRRRSRGITARELRGYRKVASLLHKEGMVSKRARGRH